MTGTRFGAHERIDDARSVHIRLFGPDNCAVVTLVNGGLKTEFKCSAVAFDALMRCGQRIRMACPGPTLAINRFV